MYISPLPRTLMHTFHDPACGDITVTADNGHVTVAFERLEVDDVIMPFYTLTLDQEHIAAWIAQLLRHRGHKCTEARLPLQELLSRTKSDPRLVYYMNRTTAVILVRDGRVLKTGFRQSSMSDFLHSIREDGSSDRTSTAVSLVQFARELIC